MSGIEMYIKENIGEFDAYPVPEGSRNAFLKKVKAEKSRGRITTRPRSSILLTIPVAFIYFTPFLYSKNVPKTQYLCGFSGFVGLLKLHLA